MGKIILNGIPYTAGKVNDIEVNSASIVDQDGIAELSEVAVSGDYDDLTNKPTIPSDENVMQTGGLEVITDNDYEVLLSGTPDNTTRTEGTIKTDRLTFNPRYSNLQVHKTTLKKIVNDVFDNGVVTAGSTDSGTHYPELWTFDQGTTREDGGRVVIKCPDGGHENGVYLSINNGSNYSPIALNDQNRLTTQFAQNTYIELIYEENGAVEAYSLNGGASTVTATGIWRVLNITNNLMIHIAPYSGTTNSRGNLSITNFNGKKVFGATVANVSTYVACGSNSGGNPILCFRNVDNGSALASTAVSGYVFYSD